jgi:hypothetical protein
MAWLLINLKTLCVACHLYWWHLNPLEAYEWFKQKYPDRYRQLKKLSQQIVPKPDLLQVKAEYERLIKKYEQLPSDR